MRAPEQPQRDDHQRSPNPLNKSRNAIVGKSQQGSKQIENWEDHASDCHDHYQDNFAAIAPAHRLHLSFASLLKDPANNHVGNETNQKNNIPGLHESVAMFRVTSCNSWFALAPGQKRSTNHTKYTKQHEISPQSSKASQKFHLLRV